MVEIISIVISGLPFVVAGVTLLWLRWSAVRAGVATLAAALLGAWLWPTLGLSGFGGAVVGGMDTSVRVLFVLFGGLLLYNVLASGGAVSDVSRFLGRIEPDGVTLAVVVSVGVGPFFESVTGFGVAVVICAPILLAAGFSPIRAAAISMWGQCAVPWGALGIGTVVGADLSGLSFATLSDASAWLNLPLYPVYAVAATLLAGGADGLRRHGIEAVSLGFVAGFGTLMSSLYLIPELSGAVGGLCATIVFLAIRRSRLRDVAVPSKALSPYGVLLVLITISTLLFSSAIENELLSLLLTGPGLPLLISGAVAAIVFRLRRERLSECVGATFRQWLPTAGSVVAFVFAGQIIAVSGAAETLARPAAFAGAFYPVAASVIGAAGGALTGSNAASNALFMPLQIEAARGLGISDALISAVQNVTGSHASMLAPQRVILAAAAVGMIGREGEIVRAAFAPVAAAVAIVTITSLLTFILL